MSSFLPVIRKAIAQGFKGRLLVGKVRRRTTILNDYNDTETLSYADYAFDGHREDFDAQYRALAQIPAQDVKILVILGSTTIMPTQDDLVQIGGAWHKVRRVMQVDPASATAMLQAFQVPDSDAN